jgi:hypothetical protein
VSASATVAELLAEDLGRLAWDPLGFVIWAYPWDTDPSIQVVPLPEPWRSRYGLEWGPDRWACELLEAIGEQVCQRRFGGDAVPPLDVAIASGHGIGKSAITAWIADWIRSTRPRSRGTCTANTGAQLRSKTWAQILAWGQKSVTAPMWDFLDRSIRHKSDPERWRLDAATCRKENSEAFAGQHAAGSTSYYLFDEASAIPDKIWEVSDGGLALGESMRFAFGNPTRLTGRFADALGRRRHRISIAKQIDSRSCHLPNKELIQQWVDDYGEDSDFVRVRVRGELPRAGTTQLIPLDLVAAARRAEPISSIHDPLIMGVDIAREGDDETVVAFRRGRDARTLRWEHWRIPDGMQVAARVAELLERQSKMGDPVDAVFMDAGGVGGPVVDRVRQLGWRVSGVNSGERARDPVTYYLRVAEMWGRMRDWLREGAAIPDDAVLEQQLISREYGFTNSNQLAVTPKKVMKRDGLESPDRADALAFTFADPVAPRQHGWAKPGDVDRTPDWEP